MSFEQIERILGFKLPKSAYEYETWWSGRSHARVWLSAGWRTQDVNLAVHKVTFRRQTRTHGAQKQKRDPWGCMAGTVTMMPGTDLVGPVGERWNAEESRL